MEKPSNIFTELLSRIDDYLNTTLSLTRLKLIRSASRIITGMVARVATFIMVMLFLVFSGIGCAIWLGEITGKLYYGFFIISGFYLLMAIIFRAFLSGWLKKSISNFIIKEALH